MGIGLSLLFFFGIVYVFVAVVGSLLVLALTGMDIYTDLYHPDVAAYHARGYLKFILGWPFVMIKYAFLLVYGVGRGLFAVITNR